MSYGMFLIYTEQGQQQPEPELFNMIGSDKKNIYVALILFAKSIERINVSKTRWFS